MTDDKKDALGELVKRLRERPTHLVVEHRTNGICIGAHDPVAALCHEAASALESLERGRLEAKNALEAMTKERDELRAKYHELLYGVSQKHVGETRHETALRYILNAEKSTDAAGEKQAALTRVPDAKGCS